MGRQVRSRDHAGQSSGTTFRSHPFLERVGRHDAAALLEWLPPGRGFGDEFGAGIGGGQALDAGEFFGEERDQSPACQDPIPVIDRSETIHFRTATPP